MAAFWAWFQAHAPQVATIRTSREPIADELKRELGKVESGLVYQIGIRQSPAPMELVISADGQKDRFETVRLLVAAAPSVPGWRIVAFRQRTSSPEIQHDEVDLRAADTRFLPLNAPSRGAKLDVAIFVHTTSVNRKVIATVFLLLDGWLGEVDTELFVGKVEVRSDAQVPAGARPFSELPAVVDSRK